MDYTLRETPYYVIDQQELNRNIEDFQSGMDHYWKTNCLAYSVKTNSLPWILKAIRKKGILAEVVSDEEYQLCLACGYEAKDIIFNGPIKTKELFIQAIHAGTFVNIDSERELAWFEQEKPDNGRFGIRVNVPTGVFDSADIDYSEDGFRFGFSEYNDALGRALDRILIRRDTRKIGLHLHCNSITRSREVYCAISKYIVYLVEKYQLTPDYIDIGGGFFGGVPGKPTAEDYFRDIAEELRKTKRTADSLLIAEPGSAIIGSVVDYVTSVLDVKDTDRARIVTTDGSRIHIDSLWKKKRYQYSLVAKKRKQMAGTQIICGYTCMDHDRLMKLTNVQELRAGDRIVYHKVGAYSMTFGGPFIRYYPEVYVKNANRLFLVRNRISVEEYMQIHSISQSRGKN